MQRPRLAMLRQATRELHTDLERIVEREGYFCSLPRYGDYLQRMHLFYRTFATRTSSMRTDLEVWGLLKRISWLDEDLVALDLTPLASDETCQASQELTADRSRLMGALYVLTGSSLGARVLIQRTALICGPDRAQKYFAGVGADTPWGSFIDRLEEEPDLSGAALTAGAIDTFALIREHLTRTRLQ